MEFAARNLNLAAAVLEVVSGGQGSNLAGYDLRDGAETLQLEEESVVG